MKTKTQTSRMTSVEALEYCVGKSFVLNGVSFDAGYLQCELQFIWAQGEQPIAEIMSLGFSRGEAMKLWNARPKNEAEQLAMEGDVRRLRNQRGLRSDPSGLRPERVSK